MKKLKTKSEKLNPKFHPLLVISNEAKRNEKSTRESEAFSKFKQISRSARNDGKQEYRKNLYNKIQNPKKN
jgi:hypothetical protein